jgi:hypothetical protein
MSFSSARTVSVLGHVVHAIVAAEATAPRMMLVMVSAFKIVPLSNQAAALVPRRRPQPRRGRPLRSIGHAWAGASAGVVPSRKIRRAV